MTKALLAAIALPCGNMSFAQSPIRVEYHAKWKQTNENKVIVDDDGEIPGLAHESPCLLDPED